MSNFIFGFQEYNILFADPIESGVKREGEKRWETFNYIIKLSGDRGHILKFLCYLSTSYCSFLIEMLDECIKTQMTGSSILHMHCKFILTLLL